MADLIGVDIEAQFAHAPDVLGSEVSGEMVLLDSKNWNYAQLDDIGSRIWELLKEPRTLSALVEELIREFAVNEELCRVDTEAFLLDSIKNGIVVRREASFRDAAAGELAVAVPAAVDGGRNQSQPAPAAAR